MLQINLQVTQSSPHYHQRHNHNYYFHYHQHRHPQHPPHFQHFHYHHSQHCHHFSLHPPPPTYTNTHTVLFHRSNLQEVTRPEKTQHWPKRTGSLSLMKSCRILTLPVHSQGFVQSLGYSSVHRPSRTPLSSQLFAWAFGGERIMLTLSIW